MNSSFGFNIMQIIPFVLVFIALIFLAMVSKTYKFPVRCPKTTSPYGWRVLNGQKHFHYGMDVISTCGDLNIYAPADSVVKFAAMNGTAGNHLILYSNKEGIYFEFMHLNEFKVKLNDSVKRGQIVAIMGTTGYSTGVHLHFGAYKVKNGQKEYFDPSKLTYV